jgi:DNA-binding transcriptional regulator YiaG
MTHVDDPILDEAKRAQASWKEEAQKRRAISSLDPVADTLDFCAADLAERLRTATRAAEEMTPEQYAAAEGVTVQTVRNWIRRGQLVARHTAKGYRIAKDAVRTTPTTLRDAGEALRAS